MLSVWFEVLAGVVRLGGIFYAPDKWTTARPAGHALGRQSTNVAAGSP